MIDITDPRYNVSHCDTKKCRGCFKEIPTVFIEVKQLVKEVIDVHGEKVRRVFNRVEEEFDGKPYYQKIQYNKKVINGLESYMEKYLSTDRSNRIDCEVEIKGKYKLNHDGEPEPLTRYVSFHIECWRKQI